MPKGKFTYFTLILMHVALGFLLLVLPVFAKIYDVSIIIIGVAIVVKTKNKHNEVLYISGYIVGSEVLMRMTGGNFVNEFSKYGVILFMLLGFIYSGFSKNSIPFWIYLLLLVPGIVLSTVTLDISSDIKKAIFFNITGPVCLGIASIYTYRRRISLQEIDNVFFATALPILSTACYLFFFNPSVRDVVTGTSSNFETSGGFGPNQVATILGLGFFLFFTRIVLYSKNITDIIINSLITLLIAFRCIVTFSRGGVFAGVAIIILFLIVVYASVGSKARLKMSFVILFTAFAGMILWAYSSYETSGMIDKRYANEDGIGRKKESQLSGREILIETEWNMFLENPVLGIGVGKNKEYREHLTGIDLATHNELTRLLAEHGTLGIVAILILLITPIALYIDNRANIYVLCCFVFWLLTINHAAMRIAAPAFIYSLSLLKVYSIEKSAVHRK